MINISHVKKYEQWPPFYQYINLVKLILILCIVLTSSAINTCAKEELSLEISEKYYKKDAILKFNEAVKKWEEENTKEAIGLWKKALKIDPSLWVAYLGLGQAYDELEEFTNALDAYNQYLKIAPEAAPDRKSVKESIEYLTHILRHGEEVLKGEDYLSIVQTEHEGKNLYVRWDLSKPLKIYFYPARGVTHYRKKFQNAFLDGASIWKRVLPDLKFEIIDNSILTFMRGDDRDKQEKKLIDQAQIKVVFPSRFKVKGDPDNPIAKEFDAYSFPIIRDKKNFRIFGKIMVSPYIYYQTQIAIPLEPLSKLEPKEQIKKLRIVAAREVGHALGLWGFSPNPNDLMTEGEIIKLKLSKRDINTMKKLYKLDPKKTNLLTNL